MNDRLVDFRLLRCLQTLVAERHVTRAAERLNMSQPKLSSALARLRQLTGDPLLVRTPEGMMPTPMARELAEQSAEFLEKWEGLVNPDPNFSPESTSRVFKVQAIDFLVQDLLVDVIHELRTTSPHVGLSIGAPFQNTMRETLESGEVDLVIGYVPNAPQEFLISQVMSYKTCCIAAADHPRIGASLGFDDYVRESHVVATFGRSHQRLIAEQYVDSFLTERNVQREVEVFVPSILVIPDIVATTDLLALVPQSLAKAAAARMPLTIFDPPFPLPRQDIAMIWHARTKNDPANRWLRSVIRHVAKRRGDLS